MVGKILTALTLIFYIIGAVIITKSFLDTPKQLKRIADALEKENGKINERK